MDASILNRQEFYPFLFGAGLLVTAVFAFWLGIRSGRRRERVSMTRQRWKHRQSLIDRHRQEQQNYTNKILGLELELERLSQESESYQEKLADIAYYRQKVLICEQQIKQLSSAESDNVAWTYLYQLKENPTHTNLSKHEWDALFALTDSLFNHALSSLQERYGLTRHEQEICCLIKWNFPRKEQLAVFNNTSEALTKSKNRLKKRLQLDEKGDVDSFIRLY